MRDGEPHRAISGLRIFGSDDLAALSIIHEQAASAGAFRFVRDRITWERILARLEFEHHARGEGENLFWVLDGSNGPEAYAIIRTSPDTLRWREHGALPSARGRLSELFWGGLATARQGGMKRIEGWTLPAPATGAPLYPIARRRRPSRIILARSLVDRPGLPPFDLEEEWRIGELDSF